MPMAVKFHDDLFMPIVVCDQCGEEITEAAKANYQWLFNADDPHRAARMYFTHKRCCRAFEQRHGGRWCWCELQCLPIYLGTNLRIKQRAARQMVRFFGRH